MTQSELMQKRFDLDLSLLRANRAKQVVESVLRQAKYGLREAKVAETEYPGSFRSFRDRLTGRREEAETALRHAVQKAEADLAAAQRELPIKLEQISALEEKLSQLPPWDTLRSPETDALWCRLEALYCAETLVLLLEFNRLLLLERRNQFNGTYAGQVKSWQELADIYSAPEAAGEDCKTYILRLKTALDGLGIPFGIPSYFESPTAFLSSVTQYTRMDRVNTAIAQTESMQQLLPKLQKQLEESP